MPVGPVDSLRLFFALVPDAYVRDALDEIARDVAIRASGRAVAADSIHLTLAFLGSTPAAAVDELFAIADALPRHPFSIVLDRFGGFRRQGIAWVGASRVPEELETMQRALVQALAARAFPVDPKPFRLHLTLARKCAHVESGPLQPQVHWSPADVMLVASTLSPKGSRYRGIGAWPLDQVPTGTV